MKAWEDRNNNSLADMIAGMVEEGVQRVCPFDSSGDEAEKAIQWSQRQGLSEQAAHELDEFHFAVKLELIELAARLGYALALVGPSLISYEEWLQAAISKAGLHSYEPHIEFDPWSEYKNKVAAKEEPKPDPDRPNPYNTAAGNEIVEAMMLFPRDEKAATEALRKALAFMEGKEADNAEG